MFSPIPAKSGNGPDFVVIAARPTKAASFEIGAAWRKTSKKGKAVFVGQAGWPGTGCPINCALTPQHGGSHALVWNRKDDAPADEQAAA